MHTHRGFLSLYAPGVLAALIAVVPGALRSQATASRAAASQPAQVAPNPKLEPDEVVAIILRALQHNDAPRKDAGITLTFEFASPGNKAAVGPLPKFIELVKNPAYALLLNHKSADRSPLKLLGDAAEQRVIITDAKGVRALFIFLLSKQRNDPCKGCWMTDGVVRDEVPRAPGIIGARGE